MSPYTALIEKRMRQIAAIELDLGRVQVQIASSISPAPGPHERLGNVLHWWCPI